MRIFECAHCRKTVTRRHLRKYCSHRCHGDAIRAQNLPNRRRCPMCNEPVPPKHRAKYCGRKCASEASHQDNYWGVPKWDEAFRSRVAQLWSTGMTTVAIGAAMVPQVSKNVIISLARRMGLPKRASPIRRGSVPKPPRLYPPRVNQWTPRMKTLEPIVVDIASLFGVEAVRKPVQKRELPPPPPVPVSPHRTCQWPIGEPRKPGFRFCGEATALGYSYCPHHCRQAYVNWQGRPMAMAA